MHTYTSSQMCTPARWHICKGAGVTVRITLSSVTLKHVLEIHFTTRYYHVASHIFRFPLFRCDSGFFFSEFREVVAAKCEFPAQKTKRHAILFWNAEGCVKFLSKR